MKFFYLLLIIGSYLINSFTLTHGREYINFNKDQNVPIDSKYSNIICPTKNGNTSITNVKTSDLITTDSCSGSTSLLVYGSEDRYSFTTIKTNNRSLTKVEEYIKNITKSPSTVFILQYNPKYTIFTFCKDINKCGPKNIEDEIVLPISDQYSACDGKDNSKSMYKFSGNNVELICFQFIPALPTTDKDSYCLNGGTRDLSYKGLGIKCNCKPYSPGVERGPRCEVSELDLKINRTYRYALGNFQEKLVLEFQIFASNSKLLNTIFQIVKDNSTFFSYVINEQNNVFTLRDNTIEFAKKVDIQKWIQIRIEISKNLFLVTMDSERDSREVNLELPINLDTGILKMLSVLENRICIRKFYVNKILVDLDSKVQYSCCKDRCEKCVNKTCLCLPFISNGKSEGKCIEKIETNGNMHIGVGSKKTTGHSYDIPTNILFAIRTLLTTGNITTIEFDSSKEIIISIKRGILTLKYNDNSTTSIERSIDLYPINNGQWHKIKLEINYFNAVLWFNDLPLPYNSVQISHKITGKSNNISLGKLTKLESSPYNLTACFTDFLMLQGDGKLKNLNLLNDTENSGCTSNFTCSSVCDANMECVRSWQNATCQCKSGFQQLENGTCVYEECVVQNKTYICQNSGTCKLTNAINGTNQTFVCICPPGFYGVFCENATIYKSGLWWIAVLIVLLLLLILIILLICCLCCRSKNRQSAKPDINQINENAVKYNEQAGEEDYKGPPINYDLIKKALQNDKVDRTKANPNYNSRNPKNAFPPSLNDLDKLKNQFDEINPDLILDQPLDYGFEGADPDELGTRYRQNSLSSLGSKSTDSQLNIQPITEARPTSGDAKQISNIYKNIP